MGTQGFLVYPMVPKSKNGKTVRGTLGHAKEAQPPVHLLSLYECQSGIVLAQTAVKSKENEMTAAAALLHHLLVKGRILSANAIHTQKKWCASVNAYEGYYLVIAKENQPGVLQDLLDFYHDQDAEKQEWEYSKTVKKGHGRLEVRSSGQVPR